MAHSNIELTTGMQYCYGQRAEQLTLKQKILNLLILAAIVGGAYFLLRHRVLWLDSFDGVIEDKLEQELATVSDSRKTQEISHYFLRIGTRDGRTLDIEVPQDIYFRARRDMEVHKSPFTTAVQLQP